MNLPEMIKIDLPELQADSYRGEPIEIRLPFEINAGNSPHCVPIIPSTPSKTPNPYFQQYAKAISDMDDMIAEIANAAILEKQKKHRQIDDDWEVTNQS